MLIKLNIFDNWLKKIKIVDFRNFLLYTIVKEGFIMNLDDKIIIDDEVEIKYDENLNHQEQNQNTNYSNNNIQKLSTLNILFSKKYLALTTATISIVLTLFLKFLIVCGATSRVFFGIWFFLCAGFATVPLIMNVINFAKNKKVDLNVSSILTFLAILILFLI